jgi:hypothetical protein
MNATNTMTPHPPQILARIEPSAVHREIPSVATESGNTAEFARLTGGTTPPHLSPKTTFQSGRSLDTSTATMDGGESHENFRRAERGGARQV